MKSRMDVDSIDAESTFEEVISLILECGRSRIPVYNNNFDQILGVLFIKDLLPHINKTESLDWKTLIRKPFFVPENKKKKGGRRAQ